MEGEETSEQAAPAEEVVPEPEPEIAPSSGLIILFGSPISISGTFSGSGSGATSSVGAACSDVSSPPFFSTASIYQIWDDFRLYRRRVTY